MPRIFTDHDRWQMMAAAEGFSPNDWDADPGDPEVGPSPCIIDGFETQMHRIIDSIQGIKQPGDVDRYPTPFPPYTPEMMRGENDMYAQHQFEERYDRHYARGVRG